MSTPSLGDAEPTLVEKLRQIANAKLGDPMPECLIGGFNNWATQLSQLAGAAADALDQRWHPTETLTAARSDRRRQAKPRQGHDSG